MLGANSRHSVIPRRVRLQQKQNLQRMAVRVGEVPAFIAAFNKPVLAAPASAALSIRSPDCFLAVFRSLLFLYSWLFCFLQVLAVDAFRFGAFRVEIQCVFLDGKATFLGNFFLAALDFFVKKFFDATAVNAYQMVVMSS